jgi:hypothetical protein
MAHVGVTKVSEIADLSLLGEFRWIPCLSDRRLSRSTQRLLMFMHRKEIPWQPQSQKNSQFPLIF